MSMNENGGQSFDQDMGDISQAVRLEYVQGTGKDIFTLLNKSRVAEEQIV